MIKSEFWVEIRKRVKMQHTLLDGNENRFPYFESILRLNA